MSSLNKAMLIGNLGRDPDIRTMNNGNKVASFSIATSKSWKDKTTGEKKEATEWHNIVVFNDGLVSVIEKYLKKGSKCMVEGELRTRKWTDKDGIDRYSTEVVIPVFGGELILLGDSKGSRPPAPDESSYGQSAAAPAARDLDDEIPF